MREMQFDKVLERLTYRRKEVLLKLLAGQTDAAIAKELCIAEATVRKHVEHICREFGIVNDFPDERRCKRPELLALFSKYKPELVSAEAIALLNGEEAKPRLGNGTSAAIAPAAAAAAASQYSSICNRDVFILIDQSGSMVRKDADTGNQTRYEYLQEVVEGHVAAILSAGRKFRHALGEKICDRVSIYFFSRPEVAPDPIAIEDASQVWKLFVENQPKTKTFIAPTLEKCLNIWLKQGKPNNRGAFFIIYTDGQFNDEQQFVNCIAKACASIDHHKIIKFVVLGIGQDVEIEHFLHLDYNLNNQMPYNILVFDLVNEVDDIIELLQRQIADEPHLAFPPWVKQRYPEFVNRIITASVEKLPVL